MEPWINEILGKINKNINHLFLLWFKALFTSKNFQDSTSHRILWHMHGTLNIDKNNN